MKIEFRKIPYQSSNIKLERSQLICEGSFFKDSHKVVIFDFSLYGKLTLDCDICGKDFLYDVDEQVRLKIYDGFSKDSDLDLVECQDHVVDFDKIVDSEIGSIVNDYHCCRDCEKI